VKDAAHSEHQKHANDARNSVVEKTEELKERANANIDKHKR
jgi:hypothetical protein